MAKDRYKPRGKSGHIRVSLGEQKRPWLDFVEHAIGFSKPQIEQAILEQFCVAMRRNGATIYTTRPKAENAHDFQIEVPGGLIDVELTEFLPKYEGKSSPYQQSHYSSTMGDEEARMLDTIRKKDKHYGRPSKVPVHLIIYPTDFSVRVYPEVLSLVRISLAEEPPKAIKNISWVQISPIAEQQLSILYPFDASIYPPEMREGVRAAAFTLLNPTLSKLQYKIEGVGTHEDEEQ